MTDTYEDRNYGGPDVLSDLKMTSPVRLRPQDVSIVRLDLVVNHEEPDNPEKDMPLSTGTGFVVENQNSEKSLITCWHNFTGLHHQTRTFLSPETKCHPTHIKTRNHYNNGVDKKGFFQQRIPLYINDKPRWFVHPRKRNYYDIAAIRLWSDDPNGFMMKGLEFEEHIIRSSLLTGQDVLIAGFPTNDFSNQFTAIWKKGSIASSTQIPVGGHPKFLVDAATRGGMSGAPVFFHSKNKLMKLPSEADLYDWMGDIYLIGMYSGRIAALDKTGSSDLGFI